MIYYGIYYESNLSTPGALGLSYHSRYVILHKQKSVDIGDNITTDTLNLINWMS